jgi:hypothetical protein
MRPLKVTLLDIGIAPQRDVQDDRFKPCLIHLFYLVRDVAFLGQKRLDGCCNWADEGNQISLSGIRNRLNAVRLILLAPMVPQADLVLVVKPVLIVGAVAGIQDPLTKALTDRVQISSVRLAIRSGEVVYQMRVRAHEAVPQVQPRSDGRRGSGPLAPARPSDPDRKPSPDVLSPRIRRGRSDRGL